MTKHSFVIKSLGLLLLFGELSACDNTPADSATDSASVTSGEVPVGVQPQFVLYDGDHKVVQALVEPSYRFDVPLPGEPPPFSPELGSSGALPCVRLIFLGNKFVNLLYDTATGQMDECYSRIPEREWAGGGISIRYLDDKCEGVVSLIDDNEEGLPTELLLTYHHREVWRVDGSLWTVSVDSCVKSNEVKSWGWDKDGCVPTSEDEILPLCPFKQIPEWAVNALPNPPYTVELEY